MRQPGGPGGAEKEIVIINGKLWDEFAESCVALDEAVKQFLDRVRIKFGKVELDAHLNDDLSEHLDACRKSGPVGRLRLG